MNISFNYLSAFLLALFIALAGCDNDFHAVRIGSIQWPGYEPVYLARDLKQFERNDVHLVELPSATDVMQYLQNGSLDGAMLTLDEVITLMSRGMSLKVILVMDISNGADAVVAKPSIKTISDLKGKRLGVELSALGALMLESLFETGDIKSSQLDIVHLTVDQQEQAFRAGKLDAVITFDPTRSRLVSDGATDIFNSSRIPGRVIDVLVIRSEVINDHQEQIQKLVDGYFVAREHMKKHPHTAMAKMAPRLKSSADSLMTSFQGILLPEKQENVQWLDPEGQKLKKIAADLAIIMKKNKLIDQIPEFDLLADTLFLNNE